MKVWCWVLVLLVLLPEKAAHGVELLTVNRGSWTVRLLYNSSNVDEAEFQLVRVNETTQELWFMGVWSSGGGGPATSRYWGCRIESTRPIVVGPRGCSDHRDLTQALDSANCVSSEVDAEARLAVFLQAWQLEAFSTDCELQGGDVRLCVGPLRLALDNRDSFVPLITPTQTQALAARMFFVDSYLGPYCAAPTVIPMPMKRPKLILTMQDGTNCLGEDDLTFEGTYSVFGRDSYSGIIEEVWMSFRNDDLPAFRLLLRRFGDPRALSVDFKMYLAVLEGDNDQDGYYSYWFQSNETFTNLSPQGVFGGGDWLSVLDLEGGTTYGFTQSLNGTGTCSLTLTILQESLYQLDTLAPPGASDYFLNQFPRTEEISGVCNFHSGRLDENKLLKTPLCPEGDPCGGVARYQHPISPNMPVYVPADPTLQFRFDCTEFYPVNSTFLDFAGVERSRMDNYRELCFAPFVVPELVTAAVNPNERFLQCFKRGGYVFGRAQSLCAKMVTTQTECRLGYVYFDQRCFYKFSATTEQQYLSSLELADTACARLNAEAVALVDVDQYTETWLQDWLYYFQPDPDNAATYRVPNPGSARGDCICYSTATQTRSSCACQENFFPVCYYPIDAQGIVVPYQDALVSMQTAYVWQYGQQGPDFGGFQATCDCFPGWTGKNCERRTCILENLLQDATFQASSQIEQQETLLFFRRGYQFGHGACFNGQPLIIQANYGYGPSASISPNFPLLYRFRYYPAVCPAGTATSGSSSINSVIYTGQQLYLPCGGWDHGNCVAQNLSSTVEAYCESVERLNVNPSVSLASEPVYDGKATTCMRALLPWQGHTLNGPIVSALCNGQGTCCPFGQSAANPLVGNKYTSECFDRFGVPQEGCQCENGWGGEACTCPTPFNLAQGRAQREDSALGAIVVDLGARYLVTQVNVTSAFGVNRPYQGCSVGRVEISNEPGRSTDSVVCTLNTTLQTVWDCQAEGSELAYRFLVIYPFTANGQSTDLTDCIIETWTGPYFTYCGRPERVNAFAARFYDIEAWRGPQLNLMQPAAAEASQGCTPTTCMCNSNYDGPLCKYAASSIREVESMGLRVWSKAICGNTVLVPTQENPVRGRGELGENGCECNPISNVDPTGKVGRTTERFTGPSCECADVYVEELDTVLTCAGHGTCIPRDLPMGRCSVDYTEYLADALSEPFVQVTDFVDRTNTLTLTQEGYFIAPVQDTPAPTASPTPPTLSPTVSPTKSPTPPTPQPTTSPTVLPATRMLLFTDDVPRSANLGDRATTDEICRGIATSQALSCAGNDTTFTMLGYGFERFYDTTGYKSPSYTYIPDLYGFSGSSPVYSTSNTLITNQWNRLWQRDLAGGIAADLGVLNNTLQDAGVTAYANLWSGIRSAGDAAAPFACDDWFTAGTPLGEAYMYVSTALNGGGTTLTGNSVYTTDGYCTSDTQPILCACPTTTFAPTNSPTKSPTLPAYPISENLAIFDSGAKRTGDLTDRATANGYCATEAGVLGFTCTHAVAMVSFSAADEIRDFPTLYNFAPDVMKVIGPTGTLIAPTWESMFSATQTGAGMGTTGIVNDFCSSGVYVAAGTTIYWTGSYADGSVNPETCLAWTSASHSDGGMTGACNPSAPAPTYAYWIYFPTLVKCDGVGPTPSPTSLVDMTCLCVPPTPAPSPAPTVKPTNSPTQRPTVSPTASPTTGAPRVMLYDNGAAASGALQPTTSPTDVVRANLNALCTATKPVYCTPGGTDFMFISIPGSEANTVHAAVGLPTSAPVVGPTNVEIATSNADLFDGTISVTLAAAGIVSNFWYSGSNSDGTVATDTCTSWSSGAGDGQYGSSLTTTSTWIAAGAAGSCGVAGFQTICACAAGPTQSPTKSPVAYVQPDPGLALYRAAVGTELTISGMLDSMSYCPAQAVNAPPSTLGTFSSNTALVPIWWTDLYYLEWAPTVNTTTKYLARCNPAYQAQPPGTANADGPCPFLDPCGTLTTLDPLSWSSGLAYEWPDLRGCVLNYTEAVRTDIGLLAADREFETVQAQCVPGATAATSKAVTNKLISFGTIQCNSFIDRTINCALFLIVPSYELQCQEEPLTCYGFQVGKFFGGFDRQHPLVKFATVPRDRWEIGEQYKMLASLQNNLFYSIKGTAELPFTEDLIWNSYISSWLDSGDITTTSVELWEGDSRLLNQTLVADLVQGRPTQYYSQTSEWQLFSTFPGYSPESCLNGNAGGCYALTYTDVPSAPAKLPGLWQPIQLPEQSYVITLQINTRFTGVEQVKGVEVWNQLGNLCGTLMRPLVEGEEVFFSCVGTYGGQAVNGTLVWVRYLGLQPIWDLPEVVLDPAGGIPGDPVADVLQATTDFTFGGAYSTVLTAFQSAWNLVAATWLDIWGYSQPGALTPAAWPQRAGVLSGVDLGGMAQFNVTSVVGSAIYSGATAWDNITDGILLNFTYPPNTPLAESLGSQFDTEPIDFANQTHLDQLYELWVTWLAPRRCGGDNSQCEQYGRGQCTFPLESAFKQAWWGGEDPYNAPYVFQGNEGGCRCTDNFANGFYSTYEFCRTCVAGYGPSTLDQWSRTLQYSQLLNPLFPTNTYPFNQVFNTTDPDAGNYADLVQQFFNTLACRFPYAPDPLLASIQSQPMCAGHGVVGMTLENSTFTFKAFEDSFGRQIVPICTSLSVSRSAGVEETFALQLANVTSAQNLVYAKSGGAEMLTVVNGALYTVNGTVACALQECSQRWPAAPLCTYTCEDATDPDVLCVNPDLFLEQNVQWLNGTERVELSPTQSSVFLAYY